MPDKILCPWCGSEMEVKAVEHHGMDSFLYPEEGRKPLWNAWTSCTNDDCGAEGPIVAELESEQEACEAVKAAALRRYTQNKWRSAKNSPPETDGKYIVCTTKGSVYCAKFTTRHRAFHTDSNTHIAYWMPMPDKPTDEERSAAGWET